MRLRVTLLADAAPWTGEGLASALDREVPHDAFGLPLLPARSLRGLWREATAEIEGWGLGPQGSTDVVFGTGQTAGLLELDNGEMEDAPALRAWIAWARDPRRAPAEFHPQRVLEAYTTMRMQTAVNRATGAAADGTLRRVRLIRAGTVFEAEVGLRAGGDRYRQQLALAAAGIRRLGTARNRGLGLVSASLWDGADNLTELALGAAEHEWAAAHR